MRACVRACVRVCVCVCACVHHLGEPGVFRSLPFPRNFAISQPSMAMLSTKRAPNNFRTVCAFSLREGAGKVERARVHILTLALAMQCIEFAGGMSFRQQWGFCHRPTDVGAGVRAPGHRGSCWNDFRDN